ncbi:MAG TPA: HAMP domain-containing protein [Bryobacteraceae bacterium]|nr:HAMP domain-containing protein [Bryobacteraceae bacterium]
MTQISDEQSLDAGLLLNTLIAFRDGDFSVRMPVDRTGVAGKINDVLNDIFRLNARTTSEFERISTAVGKEGRITQRASVGPVSGSWADCVDSVNNLIGDLVQPSTEVARVIGAVAKGDLSQTMALDVDGRELKGEFLHTARVVNTMVDQLNSFASEVTRVAREVGTEGRLGGQAAVKGVAGTWRDLTESVNSMASNLTDQVRNIAEVTTAVARGDLSRKITVQVRGEILELKDTINTMVDQLSSFASEVTRVAREVGTDGKLGGQADVKGVSGTWRDLTESVNSMASNLTAQVRNIADVTTAVAKGDLSRKITVEVRGEILELKDTINTMVDQLIAFASEVTRVAREVGTEGKLGGQADVKGVGGTWRDLTESVNGMARNLTNQVRNIAEVTTAVARGDLSRTITVDARGEILELKNTINTMVDQLSSFASEVTRVAREVGTEGRLGGQADVYGVAGTWKDLTEGVNSMAGNLTAQVRNIAQVTTAVANGDLSRKITVDVRGEILELKNTINTMVDQLNSFASEVTRVAREVGTDGKLGGQAEVKGVGGIWKDLTDNVNFMAANLTTQVRGIAKVVTAVAMGDLKRSLVLETKGEIAELADTINGMIDTLATFADQVTTVAREVGVEGKLGGQARVPGAAGIWRDLTDNVNQLAANLTTQVRAIADVANAVTSGDLTRSISVEAQGEVAALKDKINEMIGTLAETTRQNNDQDWLKTNIARFTGMLQGQRDLSAVSKLLLSELTPLVQAQQGTFYLADSSSDTPTLKLIAGYAYDEQTGGKTQFRMGQSLIGQCALEKRRILLDKVPSGYIRISSSLGEAAPVSIVVLPVLFEGEAKAVIELASFQHFSDIHLAFLDQITQSLGIVLNTIAAMMRTEELLKQSQALAEQLQKTNAELEEKAQMLAEQKTEVEAKNREVEQAKAALEEKAEQLALTSKYKSEFLANMSHELRTPLNNLLILAQMLGENAEKNLLPKQVKYAETIHSSGTDLLALINDILDLSKIESGKMDVDIGSVRLVDIRDYCTRTFRHVADDKGLEFEIQLDAALERESIHTDAKRLQQVLKNLLSNALKFTEKGAVQFKMERATSGWSPGHPVLSRAKNVIALSVTDTGIGIPQDKQRIIFEAFQQADGTTSRKYGGTGLGLSISRELARLLGGEIGLHSGPGIGSTFTLYLPQVYAGLAQPSKTEREPAKALFPRIPSPSTAALPAKETAAATPEVRLPAGPILTYTPSGPASDAMREELAIEDDRTIISPGDGVVLIIEDDATFARILVDLAHEKGLKALVAARGSTALLLAREYSPDAITLDINLPDVMGWILLDRLKHDPLTRHIPVHIISGDENRSWALALGAMTYLEKSTSRESLEEAFAVIQASAHKTKKKLLLLTTNAGLRREIHQCVEGGDLMLLDVESHAEAGTIMQQQDIDGLVIDLSSPDISALQIADELSRTLRGPQLPILLCGARGMSEADTVKIRALERNAIVRQAASTAQLLYQTVLLFHRAEADLSEEQRNVLAGFERNNADLSGKKVLVVDDDLRNIFALTSLLEQNNMNVVHAENGRDGIEILNKHPDTAAVLMDIMMPEMDGYETTRAIRQIPEFRRLPIIALTAKAMKGDREKCLQAGASDYVTKPVELDHLFSVLRVWISGSQEQSPGRADRPMPADVNAL